MPQILLVTADEVIKRGDTAVVVALFGMLIVGGAVLGVLFLHEEARNDVSPVRGGNASFLALPTGDHPEAFS